MRVHLERLRHRFDDGAADGPTGHRPRKAFDRQLWRGATRRAGPYLGGLALEGPVSIQREPTNVEIESSTARFFLTQYIEANN